MAYRIRNFVFAAFLGVVISFAISEDTYAGFKDWAKSPAVPKFEYDELLNTRNYELLDRRLLEWQAGYETGARRESQVISAFEAVVHDPEGLTEKLDEWIIQIPESYAALVARSLHEYNLGWDARGSSYVRDTPAVRLQRMHAHFVRAKDGFAKALSMNPKLTVPYPFLIHMSMAEGRDDDRERYLKEGLARNPGSFLIFNYYFFSLHPRWGGTVKEISTAINRVNAHAKYNPDLVAFNGYPYFLQAFFACEKKDFELAESLYSRALTFGDHGNYLIGRAESRLQVNRFSDALEDFNLVLTYQPYNSYSLIRRAALLLLRGMPEDARNDLNLAERNSPSQVLDVRRIGMKALKRKNYELASVFLDLAVFGGADDWKLRHARIILRQRKEGLYDPALADVEAGATEDNENPSAWYTLGSMLWDREENCRGIKALRTFLRRCDEAGHQICRSDVRKRTNDMIDEMVAATECPN